MIDPASLKDNRTMSEKPKYELEDLIPQRACFKLIKTGDTEHYLRPFNLEDRMWLKRHCGGDDKKIQAIFETGDLEQLAPVVFHQLEDKTPFIGGYEPEIDDDGMQALDDEGNPKQRKVTGPQKLIRSCVGMLEHVDIQVALIKTLGISAPKLFEDVEKNKKKLFALAQKNLEKAMSQSTGAKSSTA